MTKEVTAPDSPEAKKRAEIESVIESIMERVQPKVDSTAEDLVAMRTEIREQIESIEARIDAKRKFDVDDDGPKPISIARLFNALRGMKAGASDPWKHSGYEREVVEEHEGRGVRAAMSSSKDSLGGYWVPSEYMPGEFIEYLRGATPLASMGVRFMRDVVGAPIIIPKQTGGATYYWVAEGASISTSVLSAGELNMEPHDCACLVKINNRLNLLSNPGAEMIVREDLGRTLGEAQFKSIVGQETQPGSPMGVKLVPGVGSTSTASLNIANAHAMTYKLEAANAPMRSVAWLMHPAVWSGRESRYYTKTTENRQPPMVGAAGMSPLNLIGYPVYKSTLCDRTASSTATVYLADWSECLVPEWSGIEFALSTEAGTAFQMNQTWIRAIMTMDVGLRHPGSFCYNASVTDGNAL